jgi:hypothetical protein
VQQQVVRESKAIHSGAASFVPQVGLFGAALRCGASLHFAPSPYHPLPDFVSLIPIGYWSRANKKAFDVSIKGFVEK